MIVELENRATRAFAPLRRAFERARCRLTLDGRLSATRPLALAIGPLTLLLAIVAPYRWLFFVAYAELLITLAAYLWSRQVGPRVRLSRRLQGEWAQVGDELVEEWSLVNNAWLPLLWLELDDVSTVPGYTARRVVAALPGEPVSWSTSAVCARRGVFSLGPLVAHTGDPLGLFRYEWSEPTTRRIVVYPPLVRLPAFAIPQGQRGGLARADLLQQQATPSVGGLREYVPGDPPGHIHWPTVARTTRLMVKQFDQERAGALWIVLDLWGGAYAAAGAGREPEQAARPGGEAAIYDAAVVTARSSALGAPSGVAAPENALELAVTLTCSLAAQALSDGRMVGLLANDGQLRRLTPGRGPRQLWRMLGELVDVRASGELPLDSLLRLGQTGQASEIAGAALLVVSADLSGAWLPALASWTNGRVGGALAVLVTHAAAEAQPLIGRLAGAGVSAQVFEVGRPLPLLNPPRPRSVARLSPLGKVIRET